MSLDTPKAFAASIMGPETRILQECKDHISHDNLLENGGKSLIASSSFSNNKISQQPDKKPTRQWAAWTRQEEESFFTALRQVGKNFEKITCCVQSKNKDQVRHYYYRLVRRMNKLLGPSFCLDAKNSKDTNAAMLRWWSLLEKYSCKASKLHLKPRRFKIFIEALEHQLLKDRKKNSRKRSSLGENCPPLSPTSLSIQSKQSGNANCAVKFVLVDSQNIQKGGNGRGSTARRISNTGASRIRGDLSPTKASRQRRKPGGVLSAAAVKRWEMAAIAGMSLVADAAEHLERLAGGKKEAENHSALTSSSLLAAGCNNEISLSLTKKAPSPVQNFDCDAPPESSTKSTMKLKLQLFPIDDVTRRALEMDKHNPHLELTLSTRKKIASVLEHLNRKWGASTVACGELMLFPYTAQRENLPKCQRWNQDSFVSAADVHAAIGNPPVFRLRYGWVPVSELQSFSSLVKLDNSEQKSVGEACTEQLCMDTSPTPGSWNEQLSRALSFEEISKASMSDIPAVAQSMTDLPEDATVFTGPEPKINLFNSLGFGSAVWPRSEAQGAFVTQETETMGAGSTCEQSADEWADSLTNISVGDLLAVDIIDTDCVEATGVGTSCCVEANPFSCDSFDAAIAAHLSNHRNKMGFQSATSASHPLSSIWDAEETRDAFSFQNQSSTIVQTQNPSKDDLSPKICGDIFREDFADGRIKDLPEEEEMVDSAADDEEPMVTEGPTEPCLLGNSSKDTNALTDTYWPDSLGPLDLNELGSCRYYGQEMILSESLGGLSRLIASSLDALQNCSLFTLEKKEASLSTAAAELQGNSSTFDNRIGGV